MILTVDIGNTNIVLGCVKNNKIIFTARIATNHSKTEYQYAIQVKNIFEIQSVDINDVTGSIISSVVPPVLSAIKNAITMVIKIEPLIVSAGIKTGLNILMDNPSQVGSDLIVNAVASLQQFKPPIIIIDMGTATTISVVDKNKNYIGGVIIPGVKVSLDALYKMAAQLPAISLDDPKKCIGKNTIDCMQSGIIYGSASMLDGMLERIENELEEKAVIVGTGGITRHIFPFCKKDIIYDDNLMLKGLYYLYNKNCKN